MSPIFLRFSEIFLRKSAGTVDGLAVGDDAGAWAGTVAPPTCPATATFLTAGKLADFATTFCAGEAFLAGVFFAAQRGLIPISADSIEAAIVLNGVAQQMNSDAFLWGRCTAVDPIQQGLTRHAKARQRATSNGLKEIS